MLYPDSTLSSENQLLRPSNQRTTMLRTGGSVALCLSLSLPLACGRPDPIARVVKLPARERTIEARVAGGFHWVPLHRPVRGEMPADLDFLAAAGEVSASVAEDSTPTARHAVGLMKLLTNRPNEALAVLEPLAASGRDATLWNDLAAVHYASAVSTKRPEELVEALAAIDTALDISPNLPEARFNRALIVEHIGIRESAIAAWRRFLDLDGSSEWAGEAHAHVKALSTVEPPFPEVFDRAYDRLMVHPEEARALMQKYPQDARSAAESDCLGRWAEAELRNDAAAERHLALARSFGAELARTGGDRMLERAVLAIEQASGAKRKILAAAHVDYRAALQAFRAGRPGEAERLARRAANAFAAAGSPMLFLGRFFAAYMAYEQGRVKDGAKELEALLPSVPEEFLTCRGKIIWELAICRGAEARWGDCIDLAQAALAVFDRLGERQYAAMIRELLAQAYEIVGDPVTAWSYRAAAIPQFGRTSTPFLQAGVLGFLSQEATFRRDWRVAASYTELEIEVAQTAKYDPDLADAYLRRALIRQHLGGGNPAEDLSRARVLIAAIPDTGMRARLDARRVAAEAMVASTPSEAVALLTTAIAFHQGSSGQRMFLPTLLLHRAHAYRAVGRTLDARRDLDDAIGELDSGRDSLRSAEQRSGMFESADAIFDEAVDLALAQHDVEGAFHYTEHARARALLDILHSAVQPAARPAVPEGTSIIEYAMLPSRVAIFVADSAGIRVAIHPLQRASARARSAELTEALSRSEPNTAAIERSLYGDLIAPVQEWIAASETLVIVPDASISTLPFAALVAPDGRFLVEKHAIVAAPSATLFAVAATHRNERERERRLLVVVNDAARGELEPLPAADEEARHVAELYHDPRVLRGKEATRLAFIREAPLANVIHFSGHALSSEYRPSDTSIVLTGTGGTMNISDIAKLRLQRCSTVVLAACSTARGKVQRFEGTLSVARAFLATGTPSVVATLWPIDDGDAARFFPRLHEYLARGLSAAEALRAAQLDSIRSSDRPAMWAAVQVIGS